MACPIRDKNSNQKMMMVKLVTNTLIQNQMMTIRRSKDQGQRRLVNRLRRSCQVLSNQALRRRVSNTPFPTQIKLTLIITRGKMLTRISQLSSILCQAAEVRTKIQRTTTQCLMEVVTTLIRVEMKIQLRLKIISPQSSFPATTNKN